MFESIIKQLRFVELSRGIMHARILRTWADPTTCGMRVQIEVRRAGVSYLHTTTVPDSYLLKLDSETLIVQRILAAFEQAFDLLTLGKLERLPETEHGA